MPRRIDIELTSARPDGSWTWRVAGAKQPKGVLEGTLLPAAANRMPAAASYLRRPGEAGFSAFKLDVLRIEAGEVAEITTFGVALFPAFGLPPTL